MTGTTSGTDPDEAARALDLAAHQRRTAAAVAGALSALGIVTLAEVVLPRLSPPAAGTVEPVSPRPRMPAGAPGLDPLMLDPTRLGVVSLLAGTGWAAFGLVRDNAALTDRPCPNRSLPCPRPATSRCARSGPGVPPGPGRG